VSLFDNHYSCIDGHLFIDEDGQAYLYYEMVGEPVLCIYPSQDWEHPESMHTLSTDGMTVFRQDHKYYMTYPANHYADPNYGAGYATASFPLGMWNKSDDNPILDKDLEIGVSGPGHNCIVRSPDCTIYMILIGLLTFRMRIFLKHGPTISGRMMFRLPHISIWTGQKMTYLRFSQKRSGPFISKK
jgi:hypothetical protein